jgi:hypothetical protein
MRTLHPAARQRVSGAYYSALVKFITASRFHARIAMSQ